MVKQEHRKVKARRERQAALPMDERLIKMLRNEWRRVAFDYLDTVADKCIRKEEIWDIVPDLLGGIMCEFKEEYKFWLTLTRDQQDELLKETFKTDECI